MTRRAAVVVGTSIAGVRTAQALRREGYDGTITLIGEERELPYDKPPLSKALLAGSTSEESIRLLSPEQAEALEVTLRLGHAAVRLDVAARQVELADGSTVRYDDLVIATGARARESPWRPDSGVHVLRSIADCRSLRTDLAGGGHVVVVGAGFIGSEVASTCRALGHPVTLVDPAPVPMARLIGPELGARMVELHRRHGVTTWFGVGVEDISGQRGDLRVRLTDGSELACATVVVGIGARPNDEWLDDSGLIIDDGVICDEFGRTSAPSVYALGDVARWHHPRRRQNLRLEHWTNAVDQSRCIARAVVASATSEAVPAHDPVEFVWSDQHDWKIHIIGDPARAVRELTVDLSGEGTGFVTLYASDDELLCGGMTVNWPKASITLRRALTGGSSYGDALERIHAISR